MNRRNLLGAAAAAPLAAPMAVNAVMGNATKDASTFAWPMSAVGDFPPIPPYDEVADLKNQLAGLLGTKVETPDSRWYRSGDDGSEDIDALKSVSSQHKQKMRVALAIRASSLRDAAWLEERIDEVKKRLGVLGHFI